MANYLAPIDLEDEHLSAGVIEKAVQMATGIPGARGAYQASTMKIYDADASCSKLTQRQIANSTSGMFVQPGTYWLQRVGPPPGPAASPVGRPKSPTSRFQPRPAPQQPGSTYQPGPNTPKPGPKVPWSPTLNN